MGVDVSVVLPCQNEEKSVGLCIKAIKDVMSELKYSYEIIVSDSSSDKSPTIAKKLGAKVVKHDLDGYGNALLQGFRKAKGNIIIMADADNTYNFYEIPKFLEAIKDSDMVIGSRFKGDIKKGAMPFFHKYLGNPLLSFILRLFFHTSISDSHSGFRAINKEELEELELKTTGMEFASEMIMKALKNNLRIKEIPITYHKRKGTSKMKSFKDGWKHLRFMLLYSPTYLYIVPGFLLFFLGLLLMILLLPGEVTINNFNFDIHFLVLGSFLALLGFQVLMLGLYSKVYAKITGFEKENKILDKIAEFFPLERSLLIGLAFFIIGLVVVLKIFFFWISEGFPGIFEVRNIIFGLTLALIGIQVIFSSFFTSLLLIDRK